MTKPWVFSYRDYVNLKEDYDKLNQDYKDLLIKYAKLKDENTNLRIKCRILEADLEELRKVVKCVDCKHSGECKIYGIYGIDNEFRHIEYCSFGERERNGKST